MRHPPVEEGKTIIGWAFVLWGFHKMDYPFLRPVIWLAPWGYLLGATLEMVVAMGMLLVYFKQSRDELEESKGSLQKSQNRFKQLVKLAPIPLCFIDEDGTLRHINDRFGNIFGYTEDDIPTISEWWTLAYPDREYRNWVINTWSKAVAEAKKENRDIDPIEYRVTCKDGSVRNVLISGITIEDSILATLIDVTEQRRASKEKKTLESKLRQAQKMESIGTLAGGIAHDFNNILSAIMGYSELAREDVDNREDLLYDIDEVIAGANRARNLVKQILTFSRKTEQQFQPVFVQMVIKEALELLRPSLPTTIDIKSDIDQECEEILADPTQIHQVIMNLCTNAYHAMRSSGGVLQLSLTKVFLREEDIVYKMDIRPGFYLKLEVIDTGIGMDKKMQETIFEPYFSTKVKGEGTGLGLAVVHGIVANANGSVLVESEPGKGTTFTIFFPVMETENELILVTELADSLPTGDEHIMVVDDDDVLVNLNKRFLEKLGYKVTGFTSSLEALQVFKETANNFDLLVTDMTMPEMTGAQLSQEILLIKPYFPIILCTGFSELITEEKASQLGILDYIMKPVVQKDLAVSIRRLLDVA